MPILIKVMNLDSRKSYEYCINVLTKLSSGHKYNPFYALLKMRFNYSSLVFDSKLFDTDLYFKFDFNEQKFSNHLEQIQSGTQSQQSQSTTNSQTQQQQQQQQQQQLQSQQQQLVSNTMNAITFSFGSVGLSVNNAGSSSQNTGMGSQNIGSSQQNINGLGGAANSSGVNNLLNQGLFSSLIGNSSSKDLFASMHQPLGLLEVLPLNFKCISSSNGTSIEKQTNVQQDSNAYYILPDFFSLFSANSGDTSTGEF
jgi:hypothetical protein